MKTQQVIENYCHLYKANPPEVNMQEVRYFITISSGHSNVFYPRKPSKLLGQIIGSAMRRGTVLYICRKKVILVTWENWKWFWNVFFAPKVRNNAPEPNYTRPYKSEIFEEAQHKRLYRKPQKHGNECTFVANKSINLLTPARIPSIKI